MTPELAEIFAQHRQRLASAQRSAQDMSTSVDLLLAKIDRIARDFDAVVAGTERFVAEISAHAAEVLVKGSGCQHKNVKDVSTMGGAASFCLDCSEEITRNA